MLKEKETVSDEFCWHLSNQQSASLSNQVFPPNLFKEMHLARQLLKATMLRSLCLTRNPDVWQG